MNTLSNYRPFKYPLGNIIKISPPKKYLRKKNIAVHKSFPQKKSRISQLFFIQDIPPFDITSKMQNIITMSIPHIKMHFSAFIKEQTPSAF